MKRRSAEIVKHLNSVIMKQLKKLSFESKLSAEELRNIKGGVTACRCQCTTGVGTWIVYHKGNTGCGQTYSHWCADNSDGSGINVSCTGARG